MKNTLEGIHKSIYRYLKNKANNLEGKPSAQLLTYQNDQQKSAQRKFSDSNMQELFSSIEDSDIIYLGDFHTFDQSTRNLERLMRILTSKQYDFAIGLEFVHIKNQKYIDYFINNHITELEFLESINYTESWRFPWTYYKKFFEIARKENIPLLALNTEGTLKSRDQKASRVIANYHKNNPERKILVLFGEYHIVKNKLPEKVLRATNKSVIQTIIHQNLDEVYWKLVKDNKLTKDKVVKFTGREFALITSAPWLKYESQIYWYEHLSEDPEFDIHEYIIETGAINFSDNVPDNFLFICEEVLRAFRPKVKERNLDDFHLYDHINLEKVQTHLEKIKNMALITFYNNLIKRGRSFRLPQSNYYFCPNYSINRVSYLAGVHIHHLALKEKRFRPVDLLTSRKRSEIFIYFLYQCICGYFASKLINPYRKCDMYADYKKQLRQNHIKQSRKNSIKAILALLDNDQPVKENLKGLPLHGIFSSSRKLGHIFADRLFDNYYVKNREEIKEALKIIYSTDFSDESFFRLKEIVLKDFDYKSSRKREF
ncbi:ChaN family lipoprotein [Bacteriovorax sp. DB6_IX]|uniref:ChaN family lipoprotein n=1 Tax=Bacteriovorax sp. DB6_IX TaxID=1353530 RepID=UPI000389ED2B|nr:ChaN family lipoprotein [Bacteriovorax sp. DB6_IX]EQC50559.1 PF04187 domain protein [Bacteriovorax sp. DB6_IX]